mmetsp:Transcript_31474/g.43687  ORF Transcript_31474/g.43687 Transcript_31474/m.43687 type:complete len:106 (-) Transcript_31474:112-429(-)
MASTLSALSGALTKLSIDEVGKASQFECVRAVVMKTKESEVEAVVRELSPPQRDALMKHLYNGLSMGDSKLSSIMFLWHKELTQQAGIGCIIRSLTDKSTRCIDV